METSKSSGIKAASAIISISACQLAGLTVIGDGTNDCSAIVYDNASAASGTELARAAASPECPTAHIGFGGRAVDADNGLYLALTGTGVNAIVYKAIGG